MKKSKLLLILALVVVLALGVLVSCKDECAHENYGAWKLTTVPTLTADGEAVRICADCNAADTATVAKLSDTSVWTKDTSTAGKTVYTSTYGTVEISEDTACAHTTYGAWKLTINPTLTTDGEAVRICSACGVAQTATVKKLSDTSVWTAADSTATHTSAGKVVYTSATYGTVDVYVDRLTDHVYNKEVATEAYLVSAADCTHAAVYRKSCECGAVGTVTFTSGAALGHDGKPVAAVAPVHNATTLTNGTKAHYACDRCGLLFSDEACTTEVTAASLVVAVAHDFGGWTLVADATCTVDGSVTRSCATCGLEDVGVIPAHDHVYTSGKIVVVTSKDVYQEEDGEIIEGDEEATEFHAPVCDICGVVNKDAKVAHTYGDWELVIIEDNNGHEVLKVKTCSACKYSVKNDISCGYLEHGTTWTVSETVPATYTSDGYTEYTSTHGTVRLVLPKLVAPYEGKTYTALEVYRKDGVAASAISRYLWNSAGASITVDSKGTATGTAAPFKGNVVITMVDAETGAITLTVDDDEYDGFVEPTTGIMVISKDLFNTVYIVSPYEMTMYSAVGSYWTRAMAISYHIDCGTYLGHDVSILVNNTKVAFGVTFENADGALVAVDSILDEKNAPTTDLLVVKAFGSVVATFVKNSDGALQLADKYRGTFDAMADGSKIGELDIDGIGGFVLRVTDGTTCSGIYSASETTEGAYDAYVIWNGSKVAYYVSTIDLEAKTVTLDPQTITITLDAGTLGNVDQITDDVYANCVVYLPTPTAKAGEDAIFVRWVDEDGKAVTATTTFSGDVTLTAVWATSAELTIVDGDSETSQTISVITPIMSVLPNHVAGETVKTSNNTVFAGWYLTSDFSGDPIDSETVAGDETVTVYAKWAALGTWTSFDRDASFEYLSEQQVWRVTKWNTTSYAYFKAIDGDIIISFDFYFGSPTVGYDTITIKNGATTLVNDQKNNASGAPLVDSKRHITAIVKAGTEFSISTRWWSVQDDEHSIYLSDLTINGRPITLKGTADLMEGTYTCEGKDSLDLNGYGAYTWGDKSGTYVKTGVNGIGLYLVENNVKTEYYAVTLDGTTYSASKPDVEISYNFGDIDHSLTADTTNANIAFALPTEGLDVDGYVFRGWYDNAEFTGNAITSIAPAANTVVYAKYDAAATITYNYNVDGVADKAVTGKFVNDKVETVEEIGEVTNPGKVFVGWFLKDGTDDGDWGDQVTANTVITGVTVTYYAQWATPHALMGIWKGYRAYANYFSDSTTITIDAFGNITSTTNNFKGASVTTDSETGVMTISRPASGSGYNGIKAATLYLNYDADNGLIAVATGDGDKSTSFGTTPYVLMRVDNADVEVVKNSKYLAAWSGHLLDSFTIGNDTITFATDGTTIYVNPTVVAVDKEGATIEGTNYLTLGTQITVTCGETTETLVYSGSNSDFKVATDTNRGVYTDATRGKVILDGIGNIWIGTENTITDKYTVVETGKVSTTISKVYYEVVLNSDNTCVVSAPTASVTYVLEHGSIEGDTTVDVGIKVEFTLPTVTPDAGYQFVGWYLATDTSFTTSLTKYTLTSTDAISFVAKIETAPAWSSADTAEAVTWTDGSATVSGETTVLNLVYYAKVEITEAGRYAFNGPSATKTGGSGKDLKGGSSTANNSNYARYSLLNSDMTVVDTVKSKGFGTGSTNIYYADLEAGTYYVQVNIGGNVTGGTSNYEVSGTFTVSVLKLTHSTAATAISYTVGAPEVTMNNQTLNGTGLNSVYAVQLEAGKTYRLNCAYTGYSTTYIYSDTALNTAVKMKVGTSTSTSTNINTNTGSYATFTVDATGTYYIVSSYGVTFSVVEVTE